MNQAVIRNPHARQQARSLPAHALPAPAPVASRQRLGVIVCPDTIGGRLSGWDRRALGTARRLADRSSVGVLAIVGPDLTDDLATTGVDAMTTVDHAAGVESVIDRLCDAFVAHEALHVVLPDSERGGDLGRRLAARLGRRPATHVWQVQRQRVTSLTGSRRGAYEAELGTVLLVADGAERPYAGERRVVRSVELPPLDGAEHGASMRTLREWRLPPGDVTLGDAEFVVGGGLGVGDWSTLKQVASNLGASFGASRPVVDKGTLDRSRQVGATGSLLAARCYIALGISGAPQHLEGLKDCNLVIAVNLDKDAPIARRADVFIQADANGVLRQLALLTGDPT